MNLIPQSDNIMRRLFLLAPPGKLPFRFRAVAADADLHSDALARVQQFRGQVYVEEGNLAPEELAFDGRHIQAADAKSWHLFTMNCQDEVEACGRLLPHPENVGYWDLGVAHSSLAESKEWGPVLREAVEEEIRTARRRGVRFVEFGGWAVSRRLRCTTEAVRMCLAWYALCQAIGGTIGLGTANTGHHSSAILRRIGGRPLAKAGQPIPRYYEPRYRAELDILCFDSAEPNPRYAAQIERCLHALGTVTVITIEERPSAKKIIRNKSSIFHATTAPVYASIC
jgi:predicted GNAT family N-acyltransferase